jgi:hypothetical protein
VDDSVSKFGTDDYERANKLAGNRLSKMRIVQADTPLICHTSDGQPLWTVEQYDLNAGDLGPVWMFNVMRNKIPVFRMPASWGGLPGIAMVLHGDVHGRDLSTLRPL